MKCSLYNIVIIWSYILINDCTRGDSEHQTKAAKQPVTSHYCLHCDSMLDRRCENITAIINSTEITGYQTKCPSDSRICQVKRISMTTSTEDVTGTPKLWLLQRNCTKTCEEGCIVIGERTKLRSCATCCYNDYCNDGNFGEKNVVASLKLLGVSVVLSFLKNTALS